MADGAAPALFKTGLDALLRPKSLAIVGASESGLWTKIIFENLRKGGYQGEVRLINPRRDVVFGEACYPDFASLPSPVEHAVVLVHANRVASTIDEGANHGLKAALVFASGVGEGAEPEAPARAARLREVLSRHEVRICGPNCLGTVSVRESAILFPQVSFRDLRPGSIGCAFQSGGILQFYLSSMHQRGAGFTYAISTGNEIDCGVEDYINFLVDDAHTRTIVIFLEGIRRGAAFRRACERALEAGKPIIAMKIGRSARGKAQAISHTGALAADDRVFDAFCRHYAITRCDTLDELVEVSLGFECGRRPRGSRLGFVVHSGGVKGIILDECEKQRAELAVLDKATIDAVIPRVPPDIEVDNPLDASVAGAMDQNNLTEICIAWANDPNVDIIALNAVLPQGVRRGSPDHYQRILAATDKPVIGCARMRYNMEPGSIDFQKDAGIPFLMGIPETVKVMKSLCDHADRLRRPLPSWRQAQGSASDLAPGVLPKTLARFGLVEPRGGVASDPDSAARLAASIGFPIALKLVSPDIVHKTEFSAVRIGLASPGEVTRAASEMAHHVRAQMPDARIEGFLVQEMVCGVEIILGGRDDPAFGPCLILGLGGVNVELMDASEILTLPLDPHELDSALAHPKIAKMLAGFRGAPAADVAALRQSAIGFADLYLTYRHVVADIEINPLIVRAQGKGAAAVDVRIVK